MTKDRVENIFTNIFGLFLSIAILGGVLTFVVFLFAILLGGDWGTSTMVTVQKKWVPYFIKSGGIAVMAGLVIFYVTGKHSLSLKEESSKSVSSKKE